MKTLSQYIEYYNFDYIDSYITKENLPQPKELRTDFKIFDFEKEISIEDVILEMKKEGYVPANIYETLEYSKWNGKDYLASLGSVCLGDGGVQCAPVLSRWGDGRKLLLDRLAGYWDRYCRFPAVRELDAKKLSSSKALKLLDALQENLKELRAEINKG